MVKQTAWIERKFKGPEDIGLYPNILERLRGTPARVEDLVKGMPEAKLNLKLNGKYSLKEHIGHLWVIEELHIGRLHEYKKGVETLTPADMSNRKTAESNFNTHRLQDLCASFRKARAELMEIFDTADEALVKRTAMHPRLKTPMRFIDIAFFVAEHDDHHLAIMRRIIVS